LEFIDWYNSTGGREIIILHDYHTDDVSQMNFRNIAHLKNLLGCPIGYTPPGRETLHDYMSIGLGVNVLEKRLTVDCKIPKNGHWKSLEPDEFRIWLKNVRDLEASLGSLTNFRTDGDLEKSKIWFKSLFAAEDIKKGEVITDDMINCSRPGTGIPASSIEEVVGKVAKFEIRKGTMVKWADVL
jgi:sialic acid synthase SpsE